MTYKCNNLKKTIKNRKKLFTSVTFLRGTAELGYSFRPTDKNHRPN